MAIAFELVINYGQDEGSVEMARRLIAACPPLAAGRHQVYLHEPQTTALRKPVGEPYLEMAIVSARRLQGLDWTETSLACL